MKLNDLIQELSNFHKVHHGYKIDYFFLWQKTNLERHRRDYEFYDGASLALKTVIEKLKDLD